LRLFLREDDTFGLSPKNTTMRGKNEGGGVQHSAARPKSGGTAT
jgi:hypothetical protein